jgi:hypothetical protein
LKEREERKKHYEKSSRVSRLQAVGLVMSFAEGWFLPATMFAF